MTNEREIRAHLFIQKNPSPDCVIELHGLNGTRHWMPQNVRFIVAIAISHVGLWILGENIQFPAISRVDTNQPALVGTKCGMNDWTAIVAVKAGHERTVHDLAGKKGS